MTDEQRFAAAMHRAKQRPGTPENVDSVDDGRALVELAARKQREADQLMARAAEALGDAPDDA